MAPAIDPPQTVEWQGKRVPVWPVQTIDYGLLLSQDPAEVEKILQVCLDEGYFYLDLKNIDGRRMLGDQQEILSLMHRFFEAPIEAKNQFGLISSHLGYEPVGNRTGAFGAGTKDGYEMLKVSRDEIQRGSPKVPDVIKNSGDLNAITKVILSALSTAMNLTGASRFENSHRNDRPSTTTVSTYTMLAIMYISLQCLAFDDALPAIRSDWPEEDWSPKAHRHQLLDTALQ
jgi:hypothetical protein